MDKVKDVVGNDGKDKTQTATSENTKGNVNEGQGENTKVTPFTERGISSISFDHKHVCSVAVRHLIQYLNYQK